MTDTKAREAAAKAALAKYEIWPTHIGRQTSAAIDAYLAALPAREPVTDDELARTLLHVLPWTVQATDAARHILSEFDVTKKEQK